MPSLCFAQRVLLPPVGWSPPLWPSQQGTAPQMWPVKTLKSPKARRPNEVRTKTCHFLLSRFNDSRLGHSINVLLIRRNMRETQKKELLDLGINYISPSSPCWPVLWLVFLPVSPTVCFWKYCSQNWSSLRKTAPPFASSPSIQLRHKSTSCLQDLFTP